MKRIKLAIAAAVALTTAAQARVLPEPQKRNEVLGSSWSRMEISSWMRHRDALVTPEVANYSLQWCLRSSQEALDADAYAVGARITRTLEEHFRQSPARAPFELGMAAIGDILTRIDAVSAASAKEYEASCNQAVGDEIRKSRNVLGVMYERRMNPRVPAELSKKGIHLAPLTWTALTESICKLEGYYSTSRDPRLWKFFSTTRTMANVLPEDGRSEEFARVIRQMPTRLLSDIRTLDLYSSVAGRVNGSTLSMAPEQIKVAPMRLTGVALGSRSPSLMAFFTTAWREELQRLIIRQPFPAQPFNLLRVDEIMRGVEKTALEKVMSSHRPSQTEYGMQAIWEGLKAGNADYGAITADYRKTIGLAWLALNAETNIRQNEKLAAEATAAPMEPTVSAFGSPEHYRLQTAQIQAALDAYSALGSAVLQKVPYCVHSMRSFSTEMAKIPQGDIRPLPRGFAGVLKQHFEPVIADIGAEVVDDHEGVFKLHLATGHGRAVETNIGKGTYWLWTPSAMSLHLPKTVSTAEWRSGALKKFEPRD